MKKISFPITVFYDGSCSVCAEEIAHYKKKDRHDRLVMVDISEEAFDPAKYGKTQQEFDAQMHVQDGDGFFFWRRRIPCHLAGVTRQGFPVSLFFANAPRYPFPGKNRLCSFCQIQEEPVSLNKEV